MPYTQEYEGWTNRETFIVAFAIANNQAWSEYVFEETRKLRTTIPGLPGYGNIPDDEFLLREVEAMIETSVELFAPEPTLSGDTTGIYQTILDNSFNHVDWKDIAEYYIEETSHD